MKLCMMPKCFFSVWYRSVHRYMKSGCVQTKRKRFMTVSKTLDDEKRKFEKLETKWKQSFYLHFHAAKELTGVVMTHAVYSHCSGCIDGISSNLNSFVEIFSRIFFLEYFYSNVSNFYLQIVSHI